MHYLAVLHRDRPGGTVGVTVPDLPGCFSGGDDYRDAVQSASEAIALHVSGMLAAGEAVPKPSAEVDPDGGVVALVPVADALLSDRAVRLSVTFPGLLVAPLDERAAKEGTTRSGLLARLVLEHLSGAPSDRPAANKGPGR